MSIEAYFDCSAYDYGQQYRLKSCKGCGAVVSWLDERLQRRPRSLDLRYNVMANNIIRDGEYERDIVLSLTI